MPRWIECIQAEHENGTTIPVVPRIDSPPTMPRRGFQVFCAISAPPGTDTSITTSPASPNSAATAATASVIIRRGTGLIAGSPGGIGRPSFVTIPTPSPALNTTPLPASPRPTVAIISAPWVTSGSSPASLMTPAAHSPVPNASQASAKAGVSPPGRRMVTGSGTLRSAGRYRPPWRRPWRRRRSSSLGEEVDWERHPVCRSWRGL